MPKVSMPRPVFQCQCGEHAWTALTRGYITLVSVEDSHLIKDKWFALVTHNLVYAARKSRSQPIQVLHRLILISPEVDHKDRNGLNNLRSNLRPCTHQQNTANRKKRGDGFKGVVQKHKRWHARIGLMNQQIYLGSFATEEDAARAYDAAALKHFGEFASLNFP